MKEVTSIVYRYLTDADFFYMYKPKGTERGGGGQLYIDFLTSKIPVPQWQQFFSGVTGVGQTQVAHGPQWKFPIWSIGIPASRGAQTLRIYQRRRASICIPNQNINTRGANRVLAWTSSTGFPEPPDPTNRQSLPRGLAVFFARTLDREVWAGWFVNLASATSPCQDAQSKLHLQTMLDPAQGAGDVGIIEFASETLYLDETKGTSPFRATAGPVAARPPSTVGGSVSTKTRAGRSSPRTSGPKDRRPRQRTEEEVIADLFGEDQANETEQELTKTVVVQIRQRNQNAVRGLKELYKHKCQISGDKFTFPKRDGTPFTEAHHLIPLGYGGTDDPRNIIIVSALIHRMLHYAEVSDIDLSAITENSDGSACLTIQINGKDYTITWHPQHADRVRREGKATRK